MRAQLDQLLRSGPNPVSRRALLQASSALALSSWAGGLQAAENAPRAQARLAPKLEDEPEQPWPPERRVRWCAVGLGKLALDQVLPAFGACKKARLTAVVSGDRDRPGALGLRLEARTYAGMSTHRRVCTMAPDSTVPQKCGTDVVW